MRLAFSGDANDDLHQIWEYLAPRRRDGAITVFASIHAAARRALLFPASARPGRVAGTRELVLGDYPYLLVYRVEDAQPIILRVHHSARGR